MAVPGGNHIGGGALGRKLARVCAHRAPTSFTSEQLRELPAVRSATLPWLAGYRHERVNDSATEARMQELVENCPEFCGSCGSLRCARRLKLSARRLQDQMGIRAGRSQGKCHHPNGGAPPSIRRHDPWLDAHTALDVAERTGGADARLDASVPVPGPAVPGPRAPVPPAAPVSVFPVSVASMAVAVVLCPQRP
jgi:hypothetical protein